MGIRYSIILHPSVVKEDIPRIDPPWRTKIHNAIQAKLIVAPETFGAPLRESLKGLRKLRIGDYRIVYVIKGNTVLIIIVKHRTLVYKEILKRIR